MFVYLKVAYVPAPQTHQECGNYDNNINIAYMNTARKLGAKIPITF